MTCAEIPLKPVNSIDQPALHLFSVVALVSQSQLQLDGVAQVWMCRSFAPFYAHSFPVKCSLFRIVGGAGESVPVRGRITSQTGHRSQAHTWGQFLVSNQARGACSPPEDPHRPREDANSTCNGHRAGLRH